MPKQPAGNKNLTGSFLLSMSKLTQALEKDKEFQKFKQEMEESQDNKQKKSAANMKTFPTSGLPNGPEK